MQVQHAFQMRSLQKDLEQAGASVLARFTARWRNRALAQAFATWKRIAGAAAHAAAQARQCAKLLAVSIRRMCHRRMSSALRSWALFVLESQKRDTSDEQLRARCITLMDQIVRAWQQRMLSRGWHQWHGEMLHTTHAVRTLSN